MLSPDQISELHRLHFVEKWSLRKIARHMRIGRRTIAKYLEAPAAKAAHRDRASKLDPFKEIIAELLQQDPDANAPVIAQRLKPHGYDGGFTIVKDYLRTLRKNTVARRAYVRVEPAPGDRFDVDWGHFGALVYNGATRKLTPSAWWNLTAAKCIWSSLIARLSRLSPAVTSTLFSSSRAQAVRSGSTISLLPSPNTTRSSPFISCFK